jgi:hypothetical protein
MNKVVLMYVEPWRNNMLKVRTWLVIAMKLQGQRLSFRLHTSSNTPSVGKRVIIGFSDQFQWKRQFPSGYPGWRSAWVNWHNSRQDCNLDSSSTSQLRTNGSFFCKTTRRHELQWARRSWGSSIRLQRVTSCDGMLRPTNEQGLLTKVELASRGHRELTTRKHAAWWAKGGSNNIQGE